MRQDKKLSLLMGLFFLIVMVSFGLIVANEKVSVYRIPKIDKKLKTYVKTNYSNIEVNMGKTFYKTGGYKLKVFSKENENLYFYINYNNKKITSTYKKDYLEGKTLLDKISKDLKKEISKKVPYKVSIKMDNTLNNYSTRVRKRIIKEENIISLSIYNIYTELDVDSFDKDGFYNLISKLKSDFKKNNINSKEYNLTISDKNDITKVVEVNNLDSNIENDDLKLIISDIIDKKKSDILDKYNITYKYLN